MLPLCIVIALVGLLLTLAQPLLVVVAGVALQTVGFFATHSVASAWTAARAGPLAGAPGQAASLYLLAYYLGSSVFGTLSGVAWSRGGWDLGRRRSSASSSSPPSPAHWRCVGSRASSTARGCPT